MAYTSTPTHGKTARVEKNDVAVGYSTSWNINFNLAMSDASRQGQQWTEGLPGQGSWGGSFNLHLVLGNTEQKAMHDNLVTATPGTKLTDIKHLINGSTEGWNGDIFIISANITAAVGDKITWAINFQGDGAPTLSDAQ